MNSIISYIKSIDGVLDVLPLLDYTRDSIQALEEEIGADRNQQRNFGIEEVLARGEVLIIKKNNKFPSPSYPSFCIVEYSEDSDYPIQLSDGSLKIVGRFDEKGEIILTERLKRGAFIRLSTIPNDFPKLEEQKERLRIDSIVTAQPSSQSNEYIRRTHDLDPKKHGLVLVGYNKS